MPVSHPKSSSEQWRESFKGVSKKKTKTKNHTLTNQKNKPNKTKQVYPQLWIKQLRDFGQVSSRRSINPSGGQPRRSALQHLPSPPRHIAFPPPFPSRPQVPPGPWTGEAVEGQAGGGWLRPRATLRAPSPPLPPPRPRGPALGCREPARSAPAATGTAQPDRPGRCEPGPRRPASSIAGASGVGSTAGPPCQALSQPLGRRRNPELAREAPPPPRLSRHRSPRGAGQGAGTADRRLSASCPGRALGAQGPRRPPPPPPVAADVREAKPRRRRRKTARGRKGKNFIIFSYSLLGLK